MLNGRIMCQDVNHGQEFKDWIRFGLEEWLSEHPHEIGSDTYYLVHVKKSRKSGYNCTIELVGRHNLWYSRFYDDDPYRAVARCLRDLFPISENASYSPQEAWA